MPVEDITERQVSVADLRSRSKLSMFGDRREPGAVRSKGLCEWVEMAEG